jgi:hypothetical protein
MWDRFMTGLLKTGMPEACNRASRDATVLIGVHDAKRRLRPSGVQGPDRRDDSHRRLHERDEGGRRLCRRRALASELDRTVVRVKNGKPSVLNGPYAEVEEQLGGDYLIEAPDLDGAIVWAARCPGADTGAIEVRPIWAM